VNKIKTDLAIYAEDVCMRSVASDNTTVCGCTMGMEETSHNIYRRR